MTALTPLTVLGALTAQAVQVVQAATPAPTPVPAEATGPGIWGFVVTFALVVVCIPLFLSMTRKVRKVRYTDQPEWTADAGGTAPDGAPRD